MEKIKILHVITRLILGGAQENTILTCEGLQAGGRYDVTLISGPALGPEGSLEERARRGGYRFVVLDQMRREIHPWRDLVSFLKLFWFCVRERPSIVHTHSSKAGVVGRFAAWFAGVPTIVHTVHGLAFHPFQSHFENYSYRCLEWLAGLVTDRMVFVGEAMRRASLKARMTSVDRGRVVYSGIEVAPYLNGAPPAGNTIAMIARLAPLKGHRELLEAFERLVKRGLDARLLLIGDGELRSELERWVSEHGLKDRVTFTGLVTPDRIPKLLRTAAVVAHTSFREGLPRACVEGLLAGRPVVAFDFDGAREVVVDGETGYLLSKPDSDLLAERLELLLRDPDRARAMGQKGRERVLERFDARSMVRDLDRMYRQVV